MADRPNLQLQVAFRELHTSQPQSCGINFPCKYDPVSVIVGDVSVSGWILPAHRSYIVQKQSGSGAE